MADIQQQSQENHAYYRKPSLRERAFRKLGFHYHLGEDPEGADALPGWMKTDIRLHFSWADRLRLLLTGRLFVASIVHFDTPSPSICKSRVDFLISAPGDR